MITLSKPAWEFWSKIHSYWEIDKYANFIKNTLASGKKRRASCQRCASNCQGGQNKGGVFVEREMSGFPPLVTRRKNTKSSIVCAARTPSAEYEIIMAARVPPPQPPSTLVLIRPDSVTRWSDDEISPQMWHKWTCCFIMISDTE